MNWKKTTAMICLFFAFASHAQWEGGAGWGAASPITGYRQVVRNGWLFHAEVRHRFQNGFAIGAETHFVRLQKDRKPYDVFQNARLTIAPLIFNVEYQRDVFGFFKPYVSAGLGISLFNFNYYSGASKENSVTNISFTMSPEIGLRYHLTKQIQPYIATSFVLIADGPPQGVPKSDKLTGYHSLLIGISYHFN